MTFEYSNLRCVPQKIAWVCVQKVNAPYITDYGEIETSLA